MEITTKQQLEIFLTAYAELEQILQQNSIDQIIKDKILYRATERLLGVIAVTVKRLQKLNPNWQIPHYKTMLRLKNTVLWNFDNLRPAYLNFILSTALPKIYQYLNSKYLSFKQNEIH